MNIATPMLTDDIVAICDRYLSTAHLASATKCNYRQYARRFESWLRTAKHRGRSDTDLARIQDWVAHVGRDLIPVTCKDYGQILVRIVRSADPTIGRPIKKRATLLSDNVVNIARSYVQAKDVCPRQRDRIVAHARLFERWMRTRDRPPAVETESERLSAWLHSLTETHAAATVNNFRQTIVGLLRFATPDGEPLPRSDRIRRVKEPQQFKPAFTKEELKLLLAAAPDYFPMRRNVFGRGAVVNTTPRHRPDGIPWAHWWAAFLQVGYQSGQYLSDLRRIPWSHVSDDGSVSIVRHKTGKAISFRLSKRALAAAERLGHPDLLLPWQFNMATYFSREFAKFVKTVEGVRLLGPKSVRRSAITYTYIEQGEEAARSLAGHSSFTITARHYIDWSIARRKIVHPPEL